MSLVQSLRLLAVTLVALVGASCEKHDAGKHAAAGHGEHAMPKDWKFTLVKGDAATGRALFVELECYKCHEIKGERFPMYRPTIKA